MVGNKWLTRSKKTTILREFKFGDLWATVAQLVEHLTRNEDVCGSTPHGGSKKVNNLRHFSIHKYSMCVP
jgi:hypothetical protein